ncbi:MAG: ABC-F family ATP-binding cassette domain-containing protein, partial [Sphingomonadales bacterium]|nr:ABC-F family ATP-binding cassette domain-containing protein [Sphingomonadales bacterium]
GEIEPDKGKIVIGETVVFGYYSQELMEVDPDMKVIDVVREVAEFIPLEKGRQLSAAQLLERFLFPRDMHYHFVHKLSGGERRRLKLLRVLMLNPNFLILDEPTNDLDIFAMAVLEEYLRLFQGSLIVVSHDRYFMDKMVDHLFVFQGEGKIKDITGNYHSYRMALQQNHREQKQIPKADMPPVLKSEQPEKRRKMSFKEKQEFEQIEKELPVLEQEKELLSAELSSGALSNDLLLEKGARLGQVVAQIDEFTMRWLELSELT